MPEMVYEMADASGGLTRGFVVTERTGQPSNGETRFAI